MQKASAVPNFRGSRKWLFPLELLKLQGFIGLRPLSI